MRGVQALPAPHSPLQSCTSWGKNPHLTSACCRSGMLVAAGGPALVAYLIRHNSLTPVHVDAHSLFSEASRGAADPVPPRFLDGAVCRMATECNSTTGEVRFDVGALLNGAVCQRLVRVWEPCCMAQSARGRF